MSAGSQNGVQEHMGGGVFKGHGARGKEQEAYGAVMRPSCGCRSAWVHIGNKNCPHSRESKGRLDDIDTDYAGDRNRTARLQ